MKEDAQQRYLATRAVTGPWRLEGCAAGSFYGCIVIPALAESQRLFLTLASLAANSSDRRDRFLVVVVVNHRADAAAWEKSDNTETLSRLRGLETPLRIAWVDAATPGLELPSKTGGVGLARKIGLDLALSRLDKNGVLVCLDADTLVEPGYLAAVEEHFARSNAGGAVIPFRHQRGSSVLEQRAITLYELYLRHYVLGLKQAGSPFAFHCVGSAMACSVQGYLKMGGINSRAAGEDFYFLQHLQKTAGIEEVSGTTVHPSARSSHRVPFGTGKSISRILAEGETAQTFYHPYCFSILREWLNLVADGTSHSGADLQARSARIHPALAGYLASAGLARVWDGLRKNSHDRQGLLKAFHGWFDALKTVRLVHHLSETFPRCDPQGCIPQLLRWSGVVPPEGEDEQLRLLRAMQNVSPQSPEQAGIRGVAG